MANIKLSYEEIERVCAVLEESVTLTLVPRMKEANDEVEKLLTNSLVLVESSPALTTQYDKFTAALVGATDSIKNYAEQFEKIKQNIQTMDGDIAGKVKAAQ